MKYTDYFSYYLKNSGVPALSKEQWQRLLNIVFIESLITATSECGDRAYKPHQRYRQVKSLNDLTRRRQPYYLMQEMLKLSQKK